MRQAEKLQSGDKDLVVIERPRPRVEVDPYLVDTAGDHLDEEELDELRDNKADIEARYSVLADELFAQAERLQEKGYALADLADLETNLHYLDKLLKTEGLHDDALLQISREITWREHLLGTCLYNGATHIQVCETDTKQLPKFVIVGEESIHDSCDWENVTWQEGVTWLPVNARKTRLSLGVVGPTASGVPICNVIADSTKARRQIATGEDIYQTPDVHISSKYAIEEFQSLKYRKEIKQKETTIDFLRGMVLDLENIGVYVFLALKQYYEKTMRVPWVVSMQSLAGRIKRLARQPWFWVVCVVAVVAVAALGQSMGWWDLPLLRNVIGGA